MQKKLIALAVAGLASSASFAQTNVTIYGIVDMGVVRTDADGKNSGWKIDNGLLSGSRLGFKGMEDLGGGLKALFTLEYMLMPDVNAPLGSAGDWSGTATRQSYVGLTGNWGTVHMGRLQGAGYNFACAHNPVAGGAFDTISKLTGGQLLLGCGSAGRTNNSFAYVSPNWSGFTFEYNHARVTENANRGTTPVKPLAGSNVDDSYANLVRGNYTNGPFSASLVWAGTDGGSVTSVSAPDTDEWGIGADYDFGMVKIYGTYQNRDTDTAAGVKLAANGDKWAVGASIPVFKVGSIMLSYADFSSDATGFDADSWTLAYTHSLSKRTTLYGGYSDVNNSRLATSASAAAVGVPKAGGDASMFAFGVRHTF
jgi:predicted porin